MENSFYVLTAERLVSQAAWARPKPRGKSKKKAKRSRRPRKECFFQVLLAVFLATAPAWASPVKVTHDIHAEGPSTVKAEGLLKATPENVWKQVVRFNDYDQFMPHVLESFFISEDGVRALKDAGTKNANKLRPVAKKFKLAVPRREGQKWSGLVFMVLNTPFPVENRWYVIRTTQDETKATMHIYKRCWELVTGNIQSATGCWTFEPGEVAGETASRYEDQADPGGKVPEWVTRMGATQTIPEMFEKIEKLAASQD